MLSGVFTDVEASLKEIRDLLEEDEAQERKLRELLGKGPAPRGSPPPPSAGLAEVSKECSKYLEVHEKASFTNTELHKAMNLHIGNLRLLSGPLEQVRAALPSPALTEGEPCGGWLSGVVLVPPGWWGPRVLLPPWCPFRAPVNAGRAVPPPGQRCHGIGLRRGPMLARVGACLPPKKCPNGDPGTSGAWRGGGMCPAEAQTSRLGCWVCQEGLRAVPLPSARAP